MKSFMSQLTLAAMCFGMVAATSPLHAQTFTLKSADVAVGQPIPRQFIYNGFGCAGGNISPALAWSNAPEGTKSLAITVHDPDAPNGGAGFWHWMVLDLPARATQLERGAGSEDGKKLPKGARQITTDFGTPGWGGPCPPKGDKPHRYDFTVYALKVDKLALPAKATASVASAMMNANTLAKASFTLQHGR